MASLKVIALLASLTGCAGVQPMAQRDFISGHWTGAIDSDGWMQRVSLDLQRENDAYRGAWRPAEKASEQALANVEVKGDEVRFETDKLRFVGHVSGSTLSGTVSDKLADSQVGAFSVTHEGSTLFSPGSEWAPAVIP
jgi:hypothetical protein